MIIFVLMPKITSTIEKIQIQTNKSLMEVERFLFFLTAKMTRLLRNSPLTPINTRISMNMYISLPIMEGFPQVFI